MGDVARVTLIGQQRLDIEVTLLLPVRNGFRLQESRLQLGHWPGAHGEWDAEVWGHIEWDPEADRMVITWSDGDVTSVDAPPGMDLCVSPPTTG